MRESGAVNESFDLGPQVWTISAESVAVTPGINRLAIVVLLIVAVNNNYSGE